MVLSDSEETLKNLFMADHSTSYEEEQKDIDKESDEEEPYDFCDSFRLRQPFSLPDSIMHYISKNPSTSKLYQKFAQSCKYFFVKNPVIVISEFLQSNHQNNSYVFHDYGMIEDVDLFGKKIWLSNSFIFNNWYPNIKNPLVITRIIQKIYKSDIKEIKILDQNIFLNDFIFLASKCEHIWLSSVNVLNAADDSMISLEDIVKALPTIKNFYYDLRNDSNIITSKTVKELLQISHFSNLYTFTLKNIPQTFDIELFYDYIKKNKITEIRLTFCDQVSVEYKGRLQEIIIEIIIAGNLDYKPPYIAVSE